MKKSAIFYFSGTGNALQTAQTIAHSLDMECLPFWKLSKLPTARQFEKVGFILPSYYLHAPQFCLDILKDVSLQAQQVFIINVYAGSRGYTLQETKGILSQNKIALIQEFSIRMPGSNYSEYGAFPSFVQKFILKNYQAKIDKIISHIKKGTITKVIPPNFLATLSNKHALQVRTTFPAAERKFYTTDACVMCKSCIKLCPVSNITAQDGAIVWNNACEQCMGCVTRCPFDAIKIEGVPDKRKKYQNHSVSLQAVIKANNPLK